MSIIPAVRMQRQEDLCEFKASLVYTSEFQGSQSCTVRPCLQTKTTHISVCGFLQLFVDRLVHVETESSPLMPSTETRILLALAHSLKYLTCVLLTEILLCLGGHCSSLTKLLPTVCEVLMQGMNLQHHRIIGLVFIKCVCVCVCVCVPARGCM